MKIHQKVPIADMTIQKKDSENVKIGQLKVLSLSSRKRKRGRKVNNLKSLWNTNICIMGVSVEEGREKRVERMSEKNTG